MNLDNHFLIAMPEMADPIFARTVTYILQHDEQGTYGLIVNRAVNLELAEIFKAIPLASYDADAAKKSVYHGGPVSAEQGFILHRPTERTWEGTLCNDELCISTSQDILKAIALGEGPTDYLFCLGYSGWSAGQLESELKQNAWLTVEAQSDIIFSNNDDGKYQQALSLLGIDVSTLSGHGGLA